ncbi:hypothetical protein KQI18_07265 [Clostridioides mangenotii]|uniref:hypothetical protein n=1 Tax=Metaclostridioides mangenotii TaxID=1540 RepID=UPI001C11A726|nr:hypothetical protein [Clostridioides mangenotii]MBU5307582.1 hypothetical protein [Clostridioides mangenotii]
MKKNILILGSSICVFIIMMINLYYNTINLDMHVMSEQMVETNNILEDLITKKEEVLDKKDSYISRLLDIKDDFENQRVSFFMSNYKNYKLKSIESLINAISSENSEYIDEVYKYNRLGDKEIDKLIKNNLAKVTYLSTKSYI